MNHLCKIFVSSVQPRKPRIFCPLYGMYSEWRDIQVMTCVTDLTWFMDLFICLSSSYAEDWCLGWHRKCFYGEKIANIHPWCLSSKTEHLGMQANTSFTRDLQNARARNRTTSTRSNGYSYLAFNIIPILKADYNSQPHMLTLLVSHNVELTTSITTIHDGGVQTTLPIVTHLPQKHILWQYLLQVRFFHCGCKSHHHGYSGESYCRGEPLPMNWGH